MTIGMLASVLFGVGLGLLIGFFVWSDAFRSVPKFAEVHEEDADPHLIGAINLSGKERALLGDMAPDPDKEIMTVYFTLAYDDVNLESLVRYPVCGVQWTVHADGRLSLKRGAVSGATQTLVLNDEFIEEAQAYASRWPPRPHMNPPHIHANDDRVYRLVWYKRNWYLKGADDEYRMRVMYVWALMAKARVEDLVDRHTSV